MMNGSPLVSIIVPVCDGEPYIGDTLDSALGQTYRNIEVIVVDDGSRDGTRGVVESIAARDPRVRLIAQANGGVAAARNRALAEARGELIAPLDADDLWEPSKIEQQVRRMLEAGENTGLVYCWWTWIDDEGRVLDRSPRWRIEGRAFEALLEVNYTGNASVPLYRRRWLEEAGGYDETLRARDAQGCEDWDVALKVVERSQAAVVPVALVGYRRRRGSMSTRSDRMWRSYALMMEGVRQRRPALAAASIRRSHDQFALHLAGVSFWSGAYAQAVGWGVCALRSGVAYRVLPYVVRAFAYRIAGRQIPEALIPYDRLCSRRFRQVRGEC